MFYTKILVHNKKGIGYETLVDNVQLHYLWTGSVLKVVLSVYLWNICICQFVWDIWKLRDSLTAWGSKG